MPTRMSPLFSSMLYAARRAATVETSARGELEPSLVRKIGSSPPVRAKRTFTSAGEIDQPVLGTWQEMQERPLVPRLLKNGLRRSGADPSSVTDRRTPEALSVSRTTGREPSCARAPVGATASTSRATQAHANHCLREAKKRRMEHPLLGYRVM